MSAAHYPPAFGGAGIQYQACLPAFAARNLALTILTRRLPRGIRDIEHSIPVHRELTSGGQGKPEQIKRIFEMRRYFRKHSADYDVLHTQTTDATNPPQLYISEKPDTGESIDVIYYGEHNELSGDSDVTTILERHEHLIPLFVRWKCWGELALTEGADPDPIKLLSATHEVNAGRAERAFRQALNDIITTETDTALVHIQLDKFDKIY